MNWRKHLELIPEHMREAICTWIEKGQPHPILLGRFLRALLSNDLMGAFAYADAENTDAMRAWALFLHNYVPAGCFGSAEKLEQWHKSKVQQ